MRRAVRAILQTIPVTLLTALAVVGVWTHLRARHARTRAVAGAVPAASAAATAPPGLGAPFSSVVPVASGAPRTLHGDARRTHRAAARGPRALHVAWTTALGAPIETQVVASPDETTLYVATLGGDLVALDRKGAVRWRVPLGDRAYSTPCVAPDGTVYVGSDAKHFFAVTPAGKVRWTLDVDGEADTGAARAPDGTVVFAAGRIVYAARPDGEVAWRFAARGKVFAAPAIAADGTVIIGSQDGHVYGIRDGARVFATDLGADVDGAPAIGDDGAIFVGTDAGDVVRLSPAGAVVWRTPVGGFVRGPLSVARNGDVLAGVYGPTPREVRVESGGRLRGSFWVQGTGSPEFGVHGGALEDAAGTLFFGAQDDTLYAVGADGGTLFSLHTGGDVDAPATVLTDGSLVVGSDDGTVYTLEP